MLKKSKKYIFVVILLVLLSAFLVGFLKSTDNQKKFSISNLLNLQASSDTLVLNISLDKNSNCYYQTPTTVIDIFGTDMATDYPLSESITINEDTFSSSSNIQYTTELPLYDEEGHEINYIINAYADEFFVENFSNEIRFIPKCTYVKIEKQWSYPENIYFSGILNLPSLNDFTFKIKSITKDKVIEASYNENYDLNYNAMIVGLPPNDTYTISEEYNGSNFGYYANNIYMDWTYCSDEDIFETTSSNGYEYSGSDFIETEEYLETWNIYNCVSYGEYIASKKALISITKYWDDNNDFAEKRPESVIIDVYQNGSLYDSLEIKEQLNYYGDSYWSTFIEVPVFNESLKKYTYTIKERETNVDDLKYYESVITENRYDNDDETYSLYYDIMNTIQIPSDTIDITVKKEWYDNNDLAKKRPKSVILQIKNEDNEIVQEQEVSATDNWQYTFENLPKYNNKIEEINYQIDEEIIEFYEKSISDTTITNIFKVPDTKISVTAIKEWIDNDNAAGKRPEEVTLQLKNESGIIEEYVVNESTNWRHTFRNIPKYDELGNEIKYSIDEKETNIDFYTKKINGFNVINEFTIPDDKINITVTKEWIDNDNKAKKRPEQVTIELKNGSNIIKEQVISVENNWQYTFENLPKYDESANIINYTVDEKDMNSIFYQKEIDGYTIKNTFIVPNETITLNLKKEWDDNNNFYNKRPENIFAKIQYSNKLIAEIELTKELDWNFSTSLPKYDELGNEIKYFIDEITYLNNYEKNISDTTITNKLIIHKITGEVKGEGGIFKIENDEEFELVPNGENSIKDIIIKPDNGYCLDKITVNGTEISKEVISDDYKLAKFLNMQEDKHIIVTFVKNSVKNPNTTTFIKEIFIICVLTLSIGMGLKILKKLNNN